VQYKFDIKNASFREVPFVIDTMKSVQDGVEDLSIDCMKKASLFLRATAPSVRGNRATNAKIATAKAAPDDSSTVLQFRIRLLYPLHSCFHAAGSQDLSKKDGLSFSVRDPGTCAL